VNDGGKRPTAVKRWGKTSGTAAGEARSALRFFAVWSLIMIVGATVLFLTISLIEAAFRGREILHDMGVLLGSWLILIALGVVAGLALSIEGFVSGRRAHRRLRRRALVYPVAVAVSPDGEPFVVDAQRGAVVVFRSSGALDPIGGSASTIAVSLSSPRGLAFDNDGNLLIADTFGHRVVRVLPEGRVEEVGGIGTSDGSGGSLTAGAGATSGPLDLPLDVAVGPSGAVYVTELGRDSIRRIRGGIIEDLAGTGHRGVTGDGGPAAAAALCSPRGVAVDAAGNVFFAERFTHRVRRVTPDGILTTVAGTGDRGAGTGDGPATAAALAEPTAIALNADGRVFFCDTGNHRVCMIDRTGELSIVAGKGEPGLSGDGGPATKALLDSPTGIAHDGSGNIYVVDTGNCCLRMVSPDGVISTVPAHTT
jgi:sugar lactone lactonase YvrE